MAKRKENVSFIHIAVPEYCRSNLLFLEIGNKIEYELFVAALLKLISK